jgi:malic enzyme
MPHSERALAYHAAVPAGKLALATTKPCGTQDELGLGYVGADVFLGLSVARSVPASALKLMTRDPIVFGLANADPDIPCDEALYPGESLHFGARYLIPKPFDPRVVVRVATAVASAAMTSGVAGQAVDLDDYPRQLERRLRRDRIERPVPCRSELNEPGR